MPARTILITGATDGLGLALARRYAAQQGRLIIHGRDAGKLRATAEELRADAAAEVHTVIADYARLAEVATLADQVGAVTDRLDVLVNNAGVGLGEPAGLDRRETADGYELRFGVNHLATLAATRALLPLLRAAAPARIVAVASAGQSPVDLDDLQLTTGEYSSPRAYTASKLAMIHAVRWLAAKEDPAVVTANALHPASRMPTKIVLRNGTPVESTMEEGVAAVARLIDDPALAGVSGRYFDGQDAAEPHAQVLDTQIRDAVIQRSFELIDQATR